MPLFRHTAPEAAKGERLVCFGLPGTQYCPKRHPLWKIAVLHGGRQKRETSREKLPQKKENKADT